MFKKLIARIRSMVRGRRTVLDRGIQRRQEQGRLISRLQRAEGGLPILIFQMGKVGSTSVYTSLKGMGVDCVHVHRISPEGIGKVKQAHLDKGLIPKDEEVGSAIWEGLQASADRVKIITMVRDPISRNVSAYFQNLREFFGDSEPDSIAVTKAIDRFLSEYPHEVPLLWFEDEFQRVTGIDVYSEPFDADAGFQRISSGRFDVLNFRVEMPDEQKAEIIGDFLGVDGVVLRNANVAAGKAYAKLYSDFKAQVALPEHYVDRLLESRFARHFYSDSERRRVRDEWLR